MLLLAVPPALWSLALLREWNRSGLFRALIADSELILLIGYLGRFLPVSCRIIRDSVEAVPTELIEAGGGPTRRGGTDSDREAGPVASIETCASYSGLHRFHPLLRRASGNLVLCTARSGDSPNPALHYHGQQPNQGGGLHLSHSHRNIFRGCPPGLHGKPADAFS